MGQFEPIRGEQGGRRKPVETFPDKTGWQVYDQYRVNQPHDRKTQRMSRG